MYGKTCSLVDMSGWWPDRAEALYMFSKDIYVLNMTSIARLKVACPVPHWGTRFEWFAVCDHDVHVLAVSYRIWTISIDTILYAAPCNF